MSKTADAGGERSEIEFYEGEIDNEVGVDLRNVKSLHNSELVWHNLYTPFPSQVFEMYCYYLPSVTIV
jgi:hypothetical protein